jgi:hypothetical protein
LINELEDNTQLLHVKITCSAVSYVTCLAANLSLTPNDMRILIATAIYAKRDLLLGILTQNFDCFYYNVEVEIMVKYTQPSNVLNSVPSI